MEVCCGMSSCHTNYYLQMYMLEHTFIQIVAMHLTCHMRYLMMIWLYKSVSLVIQILASRPHGHINIITTIKLLVELVLFAYLLLSSHKCLHEEIPTTLNRLMEKFSRRDKEKQFHEKKMHHPYRRCNVPYHNHMWAFYCLLKYFLCIKTHMIMD